MSSPPEPFLSVAGVVKRYPIRTRGLHRAHMVALDGVDLTVRRGETVGIVGESGSGKSTLGRAILHLTAIDAGRIAVEGREVQHLDAGAFRPLRARLQMVFQNPSTSFNPSLTVLDALVDAMRLLPRSSVAQRAERAMQLLADVQLGSRFAGLYPEQMSGGQLQRVALARALAPGPDFIFLDEPTAALDMSVRGQIVNLLRQLQRDGNLAFLFVSHDLGVIRHVADRVVVMYLGEIVETADKRSVFDAPRHPYTQALLAATNHGGGAAGLALHGEVRATGFGCKLAPRCPHALARCSAEKQVLRELAPGQLVRCWRAEEIAALPRPAPIIESIV